MRWKRFRVLIAGLGVGTVPATGCHTPWEPPDPSLRSPGQRVGAPAPVSVRPPGAAPDERSVRPAGGRTVPGDGAARP
ncbi:MAG: hypothetical protein J0I06_10565, partial [Planctomycetes bacterium]|nr:hypothetical protein [Planctomycetota bacterium]